MALPKSSKLIGFSNGDWVASIDDMKSILGYYFRLESGFFPWSSKKQETIPQSTAEVEFIAAVNQAVAEKDIKWSSS